MRILMTGGGTAGHINPALAIASQIKKEYPDAEFLFVGAKGRMETELVPKAGFPIKTISIQGFSRKKSLAGLCYNFKTLYYVATAGFSCSKIIKEFKPDIAVGTGGYVCGPILQKAAKLNIPVILHEANSFPGVTVKMLSKVAKAVCVVNDDAASRIPEGANVIVTGNPVRSEFFSYQKETARSELKMDNKPLVLSLGGSLGAARINELMEDVFQLSSQTHSVKHLHSAGKNEYEDLCAHLKEKQIDIDNTNLEVRPFIEDMPRCMAAADLVICRCGAITIAELLASGKPSILIPSPNVAENHQYYNAMSLVKIGAAICIEEKDATAEKIWETIQELISNPEKLKEMSKNAQQNAKKDVTQNIVEIIMKYI